MPKTSGPLQELNALAAKARVFIDLDAEFPLPDDRHLVVRGEVTAVDLNATKGCILNLARRDGGGAEGTNLSSSQIHGRP